MTLTVLNVLRNLSAGIQASVSIHVPSLSRSGHVCCVSRFGLLLLLLLLLFIFIIIILSSLVTGVFFLVLLANQRWFPPLRLQVSECSNFLVCDVPSTAVFCSESVEGFPDMASKFVFKHFVTMSVAPVSTGIIIHLMFHTPCISISFLLPFA
jgi:hypothetical protein